MSVEAVDPRESTSLPDLPCLDKTKGNLESAKLGRYPWERENWWTLVLPDGRICKPSAWDKDEWDKDESGYRVEGGT